MTASGTQDEAEAFEVDDAIVLLLGSDPGPDEARGRVRGVTRLEKLLFLAEQEAGASKFMTQPLGFVAHNFGPFSQPVYQSLESLSSAGLITDTAVHTASDDDREALESTIGPDAAGAKYATRDFTLTPLGVEYYKALTRLLDPDAVKQIGRVRRDYAGWPLRALLRHVYSNYPQYTERSVIRDQVLGESK